MNKIMNKIKKIKKRIKMEKKDSRERQCAPEFLERKVDAAGT